MRNPGLGGVPREQKMLKVHLSRVVYHQVYWYTKIRGRLRETRVQRAYSCCGRGGSVQSARRGGGFRITRPAVVNTVGPTALMSVRCPMKRSLIDRQGVGRVWIGCW